MSFLFEAGNFLFLWDSPYNQWNLRYILTGLAFDDSSKPQFEDHKLYEVGKNLL